MIARALGVPEELGLSQVDALRAGLRGRRLLLLLASCDYVTSACADLAAAFECRPGVCLAATVMPSPEGLRAFGDGKVRQSSV
jgi:predicted ATPase